MAQEFFSVDDAEVIRETDKAILVEAPDFDEPEEQAYYQQYLDDLFLGNPPPGFDDILEWEGLWLEGFAVDADDPLDFRDWVRSPSGSMVVDYTAYVPEPPATAGTLAAFAALGALGWFGRGSHRRTNPHPPQEDSS